MGLWEWMARTGMKRLEAKGRLQAKGTAEIYEGWRGLEVIFGNMDFTDSDDLWGALSDKGKLAMPSKQVMVWACIGAIVRAFREARPEVGVESEDGEWEATRNHPIVRLLNTPNPDMTRSIFNEYRHTHKLAAGVSYVWMWRNPQGEVAELWPVPPQYVKPVVGTSAGSRILQRFDVQLEGMDRPQPVPITDMMWDRFIDPASYTGWVSPLDAAYRAYRLNEEKDNYILEMLENYEVPPIAYLTEKDLGPQEKADFKAALREITGKSRAKRGSGILLDDNVTPMPLAPPLKDLDWPGLSAMSEAQICAAFGVPPLLVHARVAQENSPLSAPNLEAAEQVFYRSTMSSMWSHDADVLTSGLIRSEPRQDQRLAIRYNTDGIRALMDDMAELTAYCRDAVMASIMQINEARARLGLPPDPKREGVYFMPVNVIEMKDGEPVMSGEGPGDGDESHEQEWETDNEDDTDADDDVSGFAGGM
jgi:HK97 family phage portal protein